MKAVILMGGEGTRLRPLTCNLPKPVVPLVNKPFFFYQLELLKKHGITEVIFSLWYLPEKIKAFFNKDFRWPGTIDFVLEEMPLGTAGAVKNAEKLLDPDDSTIVFNGDVLTDIDLSEVIKFHREKKAKATITLTPVENPTAYGLVEVDKEERVKRFLEKPGWDEITSNTINAGIYILEPEMINLIPAGINYSFERGLFPKLLELGLPFYAYVASNYWLDIGTPQKYSQAHVDILKRNINVEIEGKHIGENIHLGKNVDIAPGVVLKGPIVIGNNCKLESGVRLSEYTVIGDNCHIGKGALLEGSILWRGTQIGEGTKLSKCILGEECKVGDHATISEGVVLGDGSVVSKYSLISSHKSNET